MPTPGIYLPALLFLAPSLPACSRHKVHFYDGSKGSFSMHTDAYQLLPQPGSPAEAGPVLPPASAPEPAPAEAAAPPAGSTRRASSSSLPPKGIRPPSGGPPILPPDALPIFRDQLQVWGRGYLVISRLQGWLT